MLKKKDAFPWQFFYHIEQFTREQEEEHKHRMKLKDQRKKKNEEAKRKGTTKEPEDKPVEPPPELDVPVISQQERQAQWK